jgi:dipeptidyl aminopeptidase/acylaminoacyl peptidase
MESSFLLLEKADTTTILAAHYRPPEEFVAKAADGKTDLWSLIYKPSNFDPARRYPVIDLEYATPVTAVVPRNFSMPSEACLLSPPVQC